MTYFIWNICTQHNRQSAGWWSSWICATSQTWLFQVFYLNICIYVQITTDLIFLLNGTILYCNSTPLGSSTNLCITQQLLLAYPCRTMILSQEWLYYMFYVFTPSNIVWNLAFLYYFAGCVKVCFSSTELIYKKNIVHRLSTIFWCPFPWEDMHITFLWASHAN